MERNYIVQVILKEDPIIEVPRIAIIFEDQRWILKDCEIYTNSTIEASNGFIIHPRKIWPSKGATPPIYFEVE